MRLLRAFLVLSLLLLPQMANAETLMMATTTSTQDTGLLEYLQPIFKKDTGIDLKWISVGTGKALATARTATSTCCSYTPPPLRKSSWPTVSAWTAIR